MGNLSRWGWCRLGGHFYLILLAIIIALAIGAIPVRAKSIIRFDCIIGLDSCSNSEARLGDMFRRIFEHIMIVNRGDNKIYSFTFANFSKFIQRDAKPTNIDWKSVVQGGL
jgi:hypothetical protein